MRRVYALFAALCLALPNMAYAASSITIALDDVPAVQGALTNASGPVYEPIEEYWIDGQGGAQLNPVPSVPEPGTWAMMVGGFLVIGVLARSRNRRRFTSFA